MPQLLEVPQLINQHCVTKMQIWGCGIKARLDPQRASGSKSLQ